MAIASIREVKINPGNTEIVSSRVRKGAGILARHGAHTRIYRVVGGQGAGNIQLQAHYASVAQGAATFEAFSKDVKPPPVSIASILMSSRIWTLS